MVAAHLSSGAHRGAFVDQSTAQGHLVLHKALFQPVTPALAAWHPFNLERRTGKHLALRVGA